MIRALRALGRFLEELAVELLERATAHLEAIDRAWEPSCRVCGESDPELEACGICGEPVCERHSVLDVEAGTTCEDHHRDQPALRSVP
jgi:hypothetical protein